nr:hypothetical protein GCM10020185_84120 [Pseudomonas brassicacearum subsp. brassicacearum]
MAEIIRAGIGAVDKGQYEAGRSLGMTFAKLMRRIVLPQAFRVIVPPLGNEFNVMLKNTTLVSVIGVQELLLSTQMVTSATFRVFELYLVVAIYFLLLTTLWGFFSSAGWKPVSVSRTGPRHRRRLRRGCSVAAP